MKLELDLPEEEIRNGIKATIKIKLNEFLAKELAKEVTCWGTKQKIKEGITKQLPGVINELIAEALRDAPRLKVEIAEGIQKRLSAQLNAAIRRLK